MKDTANPRSVQNHFSWKRSLLAATISASLLGAPTLAFAAGETGAIIGVVHAQNGESVSGAVVKIVNSDTGLTREINTDDDGSYRFPQLPIGHYDITVTQDGRIVAENKVRVSLGANVNANFDVQIAGAEVIEVVGARPSVVDVTSTDSGLVMGEAEFDAMPVGRNLTAVALLAPGTVEGDSKFGTAEAGNLASFGGASVSENSCYINGLEVTDTRFGLGCGSVPFEFYQEFQVKTGGYSAQFGRTTGGLINSVTKSGTNTWEFAVTANYRPKGLQSDGSTSYATAGQGELGPNAGVANVFRDFSGDYADFKEMTLSASGPLIQDKLFIYALYNPRELKQVSHGNSTATPQYTGDDRIFNDKVSGAGNAFWGAKIDWDIVENHRLSVFAYSDRRDIERTSYTLDPNTGATSNPRYQTRERGGEASSITYNGRITDDLTVSAMMGQIETQFFNRPSSTVCPNITDTRGVTPAVPSCFVGNDGSNFDKNKQQRLDFEWALGDAHLLRFGLDYQDRDSEQITLPSGGAGYAYSRQIDGASIQIQNGNTWTNNSGGDLDIVAMRVFTGGGAFNSDMKAYYLEDNWQLTDNITFNIGVRYDQLTNKGTTGVAFADFEKTAPRLGLSWDPTGNGTSKIYATWGRYFLPISNNTNFRMASGVSDTTTFYRFAGPTATFAADGSPTGITPVNGTVANSTNTASLPTFPNTDLTQAKEASPFYKDELILGYEQEISDGLRASVRAMMRDVASGLDDYCGDLAPACVLLNPGEGGTWGRDANRDGQADAGSIQYHSAAEIGLPKAKNEYRSLQFEVSNTSVETRWTAMYVWSRSYGNFEGAVKSDIGQVDAGITQDFDFPALMDGADGYQANDRRHVFKFFGSHKLTEQLSIGWNSVLSSGRPISMFGQGYPSTDQHIYGSYGDTFYLRVACPDTNANDECDPDEKVFVKKSRGEGGRTPWTFNLNLSMDYNFKLGDVDMRASVDVFNVLNAQEVTSVDEHYEVSEGVRNQYWGSAYSFQAPRTVQLGFEARF